MSAARTVAKPAKPARARKAQVSELEEMRRSIDAYAESSRAEVERIRMIAIKGILDPVKYVNQIGELSDRIYELHKRLEAAEQRGNACADALVKIAIAVPPGNWPVEAKVKAVEAKAKAKAEAEAAA